MKPLLVSVVTLLGFSLGLVPRAEAHLFTDDQGRQVEADIVGMRGANVILATQGVRGQWPVTRLAAPDQAFVRQWQSTTLSVAKVKVQMIEQDGIGEKGAFKAEKEGGPARPKDLPFAPQKESKAHYKHYDLQITNPALVDANYLRVDYVLYVIQPDGTVGTNAGSQPLDQLPAGKTVRLKTEGATAWSTKTTQMKLAISSNSVSTAEKTSRSTERFGGGWVRVMGVDGSIIGESKSLSNELAKLDPPWVGTDVKNDIPMLTSLDGLLALLKHLPQPAGAPPAGGGREKPVLPPGFPLKP